MGSRGRRENIENSGGIPVHDEEGTPLFPWISFCTDASNKAIGAVVSQLEDNGRKHPIHYASRVLSGTESNFSVFQRETLGVIIALKNSEITLSLIGSNCVRITKH